MAAVVRVKRRIDEDPPNTFVLKCKKQRIDDIPGTSTDNNDEVSTILKFAGTVKSQEDLLAHQMKILRQADARKLVSKIRKPQNVREKNRDEMRQNAQDNRFKIVNCYRSTNNDEQPSPLPKEITIVDVEKQNNEISDAQANAEIKENVQNLDDNFVYDFYMPEVNDDNIIVDDMVHNFLSIEPYEELVFEDQSDDCEGCESEDSNDENYHANFYPDSDDEKVVDVTEGYFQDDDYEHFDIMERYNNRKRKHMPLYKEISNCPEEEDYWESSSNDSSSSSCEVSYCLDE